MALNFDLTPLFVAIDKGNVEIVKLILTSNKLNINSINIISNYIFKFHSESYT